MLLLAGSLIHSAHVQDAVGVNVEGNFNLRYATGCRSNAVQVEDTNLLVVLGHGALALQHADFYTGLIVCGRGEYLALLGRDGGVGLDEFGHHAAEGFDTQAQRGDIQQKHVLHITCEHTALDGSADSDNLVRVYALVGLLSKEVLHQFLHVRDTGGAADQQHFVNIRRIQVRIGQGLTARGDGALEQGVRQLLELGTREGLCQVLGHAVHRHDVRQVDLRGGLAGKFNLGFLGSLFQALEGHRILLEVDTAVLCSELAGEPVNDDLVKIVTAQVRVTVGGQHLEHAVTELEDRDIEGTAAEVVHGHFHVLFLLVQAVCQSGSRGLVDDTLDVQTGDTAGFLGGLTLRVGEVSRNSDNRFCHFLTEVFFRRLFHLLQNHGGDFLRRVQLTIDVYARSIVLTADHFIRYAGHFRIHLVIGLTHETFDGEHGIVGVGNGLTLGRRADFTLTTVGEGHYGRGCALPLVVDDDSRLIAFHHSDAGIGCSQVDTDNFTHSLYSFNCLLTKRRHSLWSDALILSNIVPVFFC